MPEHFRISLTQHVIFLAKNCNFENCKTSISTVLYNKIKSVTLYKLRQKNQEHLCWEQIVTNYCCGFTLSFRFNEKIYI